MLQIVFFAREIFEISAYSRQSKAILVLNNVTFSDQGIGYLYLKLVRLDIIFTDDSKLFWIVDCSRIGE